MRVENTQFARNDSYELALHEQPDGSYVATASVRAEFDFRTGIDNYEWTSEAREQYMRDFESAVQSAWDGRVIGLAPNGEDIVLDVRIDSSDKTDGNSAAAEVATGTAAPVWTIRVFERAQTHVTPGEDTRTMTLDVDDVDGWESKVREGTIYTAAHEFGHVLGLADEYDWTRRFQLPGGGGLQGVDWEDLPAASRAFIDDRGSIMTSGAQVRERHLDALREAVRENFFPDSEAPLERGTRTSPTVGSPPAGSE